MQRLNDKVLPAALEDGCALALVRVLAAHIVAPGTRSESASAELAVERVIHGEVEPSISAWAYTKADPLVLPTHRYIVVLGNGKHRRRLGPFVEVPTGAEEEAVRVHREAVERLRGPANQRTAATDPANPVPVPSSSAPERPLERKVDVQLLREEFLAECVESRNGLALARVLSVGIRAPGTRSEAVEVDLAVERVIFGALPAHVSAWRYTTGGKTLVEPGRRYVVMLPAKASDARLGPLVEVPPGAEDEAVRVHREAIERLERTAKP